MTSRVVDPETWLPATGCRAPGAERARRELLPVGDDDRDRAARNARRGLFGVLVVSSMSRRVVDSCRSRKTTSGTEGLAIQRVLVEESAGRTVGGERRDAACFVVEADQGSAAGQEPRAPAGAADGRWRRAGPRTRRVQRRLRSDGPGDDRRRLKSDAELNRLKRYERPNVLFYDGSRMNAVPGGEFGSCWHMWVATPRSEWTAFR